MTNGLSLPPMRLSLTLPKRTSMNQYNILTASLLAATSTKKKRPGNIHKLTA